MVFYISIVYRNIPRVIIFASKRVENSVSCNEILFSISILHSKSLIQWCWVTNSYNKSWRVIQPSTVWYLTAIYKMQRKFCTKSVSCSPTKTCLSRYLILPFYTHAQFMIRLLNFFSKSFLKTRGIISQVVKCRKHFQHFCYRSYIQLVCKD